MVSFVTRQILFFVNYLNQGNSYGKRKIGTSCR